MDTFDSCCKAYHALAGEVSDERRAAFRAALRCLGEETGREFQATSGPLDMRVAEVLIKADRLRKTQLDDFGYVDVCDQTGDFAKGFYGVIGRTKNELFADLKRCAVIRIDGVRYDDEEMSRLGFAKGVDYENR